MKHIFDRDVAGKATKGASGRKGHQVGRRGMHRWVYPKSNLGEKRSGEYRIATNAGICVI